MKAMKKPGRALVHGLILTLAVFLTMGAAAAQADNPLDDVKGLIKEVQGILQTNSNKPQRLELIEKVTARRLDYREMAKRSLDSTWACLNRSQQTEFTKVFSQLLKAHYAQHLDDFAKTRVVYLGETDKAATSEVSIQVIRPNDKIPVKFCLLHEPQGWMIYDMVIDGVSMVDNFHAQFAAMIQQRSYGELVRCMKDRLKGECGG
jgi:phospholipid transport system substrate-binding protein